MEGKQSQMLPIGTLLKGGEYRVERYISSGGFGNTYEVVHTRLPKRFAVKEFFMRGINVRQGLDVTVSVGDNRATFQQMKEKFYKEAQRLAQLEEQHIVEVTDFFEENQTAYYVMKLIDGESLSATMKRTGKPFPEAEVRNILTQVLQALEAVHAQGIYHLDLKPGNIMRDKKNCCWIIDFGASKQFSATETQTMSTSTGLCYTPGYAPGEQVNGNTKRIGPWTDFYALGATLYCLLTNQAPPSPDDVMNEGESIFRILETTSLELSPLVEWMMKPRPKDRPQSVAEITSRLNEMPQPKQPKVVKVEPLPEVTAIPEQPIPNEKPQPENTVQATPAKAVQTSQAVSPKTVQIKQAEPTTNPAAKRRKLWPWLLACASVIALLTVIVLVNKGGQDNSLKQELINEEDQPLYPWQDADGKYGYIDETGELVIPCKWENAWDFSEGLALVQDDNGKWGFIDKTGKVVVPCKWRLAGDFSEGLAYVEDDNGKYGFINKTGQIVIPCKWNSADSFSEGMARVQNDDDKCGFIDKTGKLVIPCKWKAVSDFSEGLARVWNDDDKCGFIDKTGKLVIPCKWESAETFSEGLAAVWNDDGKWGFIDKTGQLVIPCKWEYAETFSEGLAAVENDDDKWGFIDKTGQLVSPCKWESAVTFSEGLAAVENDDDKFGFIDKTGKLVIPCKWKAVSDFSEGLAKVINDDWKFGFIDKTGKVVSPCKWRLAFSFSEGLARVEDEDDNVFYIDKTGKVVK